MGSDHRPVEIIFEIRQSYARPDKWTTTLDGCCHGSHHCSMLLSHEINNGQLYYPQDNACQPSRPLIEKIKQTKHTQKGTSQPNYPFHWRLNGGRTFMRWVIMQAKTFITNYIPLSSIVFKERWGTTQTLEHFITEYKPTYILHLP